MILLIFEKENQQKLLSSVCHSLYNELRFDAKSDRRAAIW
jgi:hypothetical protein